MAHALSARGVTPGSCLLVGLPARLQGAPQGEWRTPRTRSRHFGEALGGGSASALPGLRGSSPAPHALPRCQLCERRLWWTVGLVPMPGCSAAPGPNATKPGAGGSGRLPAQPCSPEDRGRCCASVGLMDVLINRSGSLRLWGRSCWRWHLGPGDQGDVPWGPGHLRLGRERCGGWRGCRLGAGCSDSRDSPGTSVIRRECWSRGRIVSALLASAAGGCHPSVEPPNPDAATMGRPG